ncbi:hypothetical protein SAMD00023353_2301490 [Rosellinia necatrix]|uniref:Uncharacterized protein n=1 Tax=Rosellinia necatrix TaxID=77044 RepID=A0A1S8A800_ROSNE|nr:hypothetical protein SAMD00023353_2301490 [Rosellinia necatrix]
MGVTAAARAAIVYPRDSIMVRGGRRRDTAVTYILHRTRTWHHPPPSEITSSSPTTFIFPPTSCDALSPYYPDDAGTTQPANTKLPSVQFTRVGSIPSTGEATSEVPSPRWDGEERSTPSAFPPSRGHGA